MYKCSCLKFWNERQHFNPVRFVRGIFIQVNIINIWIKKSRYEMIKFNLSYIRINWLYLRFISWPLHLEVILLKKHSRTTCTSSYLWKLSGLTCNEQNFITKAGAQKYAAEHKVIIVAPDTSPRGEDVPDHADYDLGQGAGFYVNATQAPWSQHFKMYDYIVEELRNLIDLNFPTNQVQSIMGHSMGGHGALVIGLKNPELYKSISAFAPIVAP